MTTANFPHFTEQECDVTFLRRLMFLHQLFMRVVFDAISVEQMGSQHYIIWDLWYRLSRPLSEQDLAIINIILKQYHFRWRIGQQGPYRGSNIAKLEWGATTASVWQILNGWHDECSEVTE